MLKIVARMSTFFALLIIFNFNKIILMVQNYFQIYIQKILDPSAKSFLPCAILDIFKFWD